MCLTVLSLFELPFLHLQMLLQWSVWVAWCRWINNTGCLRKLERRPVSPHPECCCVIHGGWERKKMKAVTASGLRPPAAPLPDFCLTSYWRCHLGKQSMIQQWSARKISCSFPPETGSASQRLCIGGRNGNWASPISQLAPVSSHLSPG